VHSYVFDGTEKPVAAICHGPWLLCSAKCIKGRRLTSFIAIKDDVENAGYVMQIIHLILDLILN
jgi:protease I